MNLRLEINTKRISQAIDVYRDRNDWWIGYYRGSHYHFVCPIPTLVIKWVRR